MLESKPSNPMNPEWLEILKFLQKLEGKDALPKARSPKEVAEALGMPRQRVRIILSEMYQRNMINRRTRGYNKNGYPMKSFYYINR